ncbi:MAG: DUF4369 domain-containing protein [Bacteroidales bacterium]|nr:DUF4369 domain-containing protein [Bacteroidales bacterium]
MTLYEKEGEQTLRAPIHNGSFQLEGIVGRPTVARIAVGNDAPFYLWVENAEMALVYNSALPSASHITGSRVNSEYRYVLEQCADAGGTLSDAVVAYASNNPEKGFVPFMLWLHYDGNEPTKLDSLCQRFSGDAAKAYHLPLLKKRVLAMRQSAEGQPIPSITLPTLKGKAEPYDSLYRHDRSTYLLFASTWMEKERHCNDSLLARVDTTTAQVVWVPTDKDPAGWDAPYMQQLDIHRLPYIILISPKGTIEKRDLRIWEIGR